MIRTAPYQSIEDPVQKLLAAIDFLSDVFQRPDVQKSCLAGTTVQEVSETNPVLRDAAQSCFVKAKAFFQSMLDEACRSRGVKLDTASLAHHWYAPCKARSCFGKPRATTPSSAKFDAPHKLPRQFVDANIVSKGVAFHDSPAALPHHSTTDTRHLLAIPTEPIMNFKDAIRSTFNASDFLMHRYLEDLRRREILMRPVPEANHIAWQLGHVIASERHLVEAAVPGTMPELPPGFVDRHSKAGLRATTRPTSSLRRVPGAGENRPSRHAPALDRLTAADLDKPIEGRVPPFVKHARRGFTRSPTTGRSTPANGSSSAENSAANGCSSE